MKIEEILREYDEMFGKNSLEEIEAYLVRNLREIEDYSIQFTLLNEIIGFCRDTTQKEKALVYCGQLVELMEKMQIVGSAEYATAMLNIANAYRAFEMAEEAIEIFKGVLQIYEEKLSPYDFNYASLYNNWSLAYQETQDYEMSKEMLIKALQVVDHYEEAVIPQANTRTNLAVSLLQIGTEESYLEAMEYLGEALKIYEKDGGKDFHYSAALVAMGDAHCLKKEYEKAVKFYERGLTEIEKHVGKTDNYKRILEKYEYAKAHLSEKKWMSNLDRCQAFYETYGVPMIHEKFAGYESRIAVGLVGEGSDCYGFDDEISTDHDYELGFCMWLTEEDYKKIGADLQAEYEKLMSEQIEGGRVNQQLSGRRGVFSINQFFGGLLGINLDYEKDFNLDYEKIQEYQLSMATNGRVFQDKLGVFCHVREELASYYPDEVWRKKIAQCLHDFSQYAQSNYPRMMARGDGLTAKMCVLKGVETTMDLLYLLNRSYAPYYKWKRKGLETVSFAQPVLNLLEQIVELPDQLKSWENQQYDAQLVNWNDQCAVLFEVVAELLVAEMERQDLIRRNGLFLETYIGQILKGKKMELIDRIIELEWNQFDKVKNIGGRADCQDNFETFSIMRKSQYLTWTEELLLSYCNDLIEADQRGWNLIMEKYARMMKSTNPKEYEALEKELPVRGEERIQIQEEIIKMQVAWMEEATEKYPKLTANMRSIRTETDSMYNTSYETYLRGELSTYSENTFILYTGFIISLMKEGINLTLMTIENSTKLYGYASIDVAEKKLEE